MINLLFFFFTLSSFSCFGSLFKKRYEEVVPFTIIGIILWLYFFYIFDVLNIGLIILLILIALVYLFFIINLLKKNKEEKKEVLKCIFTPGLLIYFLGFIVIYLITINNKVLLWDELRLWGAYPKILFYDGGLQLGDGSQLMGNMRSYNPGMPLFLFFVTKLFGEFNEGLLFFGYSLVGFSLLLPITKKINWKNWIKIPFYFFGIMLIPLLFANSNNDSLTYFYTLFIEPVLGILFGCALYLTFDKIFDNKFKFSLFTVMLAGMTLLKDTGILFSVIAFVSFLLSDLIFHKNYKKSKYGLLKLFIPLMFALCVFGSWKLVQNVYKSDNMYTSGLSTNEIISLFTNPTEEQTQLIGAANKEILFTPIVKSNFHSLDRFYSFPCMFLILFMLFFAFIYIYGKKDFKKNLLPVICLFAGSIVYLLGTLFVYFFSIHAVESFPRYISLIFTAGSVMLFLLLCDKYDLIPIKNKYYFNLYLGFLLIFCVVAMPIRQPEMENLHILKNLNEQIEIYSECLKRTTTPEDNVTLVFSEENLIDFSHVIYNHQIYMDLIDEGYYCFDDLFINEDGLSLDVYENYDYLYFISTDEDDDEYFSEILKINVDEASLFKILGSGELALVE